MQVCSFLCTVSLCRLCGASKALRIALKDDPNAWDNALQTTWWYPIDTLKRHDNFTFWCGQYPPLETKMVPSDKRLKTYKNGYDYQFAVIHRGPEVFGTCFLDNMRLWESEDVTNPDWHFGLPPRGDGRLYLTWEAVGEFPCTTLLSCDEVDCQLSVEIFTVFQNMLTIKYTTLFHPQNRGGTMFREDEVFVEESLSWGGVSIHMDGTTCTVKYNFEEFVEDLYDSFKLYANGRKEFFDPFPNDSDVTELLELFVETEKLNKKRGWGKTRRWILDTIHILHTIHATSQVAQNYTLMLVNVPDNTYAGDYMIVHTPSGQAYGVIIPPSSVPGTQFQIQVPT